MKSLKTILHGIKTVLVLSLLILSVASCGKSDKQDSLKYLAVQIDDDEFWSIVDSEGKVLVEKEYPKSNRISRIDGSGCYWVKSDNKYQLFSISSPRKPIIDTEFQAVSNFTNGVALASTSKTEPIKLIDTDGKVIATLPQEVAVAALDNDNDLMLYANSEGKSGYIDFKGNIAVPAKFYNAWDFNCGLGIVQIEVDSPAYVINKKGDCVYEFDKNTRLITYHYSENILPIEKNGAIVLLDKNGKTIAEVPQKHAVSDVADFKGGLCVVRDEKYNYSVIDKNGETVIRAGKYNWIHNMGNGILIAKKDTKWGVIDKEDNTLVNFSYNDAYYSMLGDNFLLGKRDYQVIVNKKGEELNRDEFFDTEAYRCESVVRYVDIKGAVDAFVNPCTTTGYATLEKAKTSGDVIKSQNIKNPNDYRRNLSLSLPAIENKSYKIQTFARFSGLVTKEIYRTEKRGTWYTYNVDVFDHCEWDNNVTLDRITRYLSIGDVNGETDVLPAVHQALKDKGFTEHYSDDGPMFEAKNGDKYIRVIASATKNEVTLHYYPYCDHSVTTIDND